MMQWENLSSRPTTINEATERKILVKKKNKLKTCFILCNFLKRFSQRFHSISHTNSHSFFYFRNMDSVSVYCKWQVFWNRHKRTQNYTWYYRQPPHLLWYFYHHYEVSYYLCVIMVVWHYYYVSMRL